MSATTAIDADFIEPTFRARGVGGLAESGWREHTKAQASPLVTTAAFSGSSINAPPGFYQSLISRRDRQIVAFYDPDGNVIVATRRLLQGPWTHFPTPFFGDINDAHNTIALGIDGNDDDHIAWGLHKNPLNYARLNITGDEIAFQSNVTMIGSDKDMVTYPQFLPLPGGDLLAMHRDGSSGCGKLLLNRYHHAKEMWTRTQDNLISGESHRSGNTTGCKGRRSGYTTAHIDRHGTLHLAWVWCETNDVASNHDVSYAR